MPNRDLFALVLSLLWVAALPVKAIVPDQATVLTIDVKSSPVNRAYNHLPRHQILLSDPTKVCY